MQNYVRMNRGGRILGWMFVIILALAVNGCKDSDDSSQSNGDSAQAIDNVCPIMPMKAIDKQFYADYEGTRYYLCCKMCADQFNKNPRRWVARADKMQTLQEDIN